MKMNFGAAKTQLMPYINNGGCDPTTAAAVINDACERLVEWGKWKGLVYRVRICHRAGLLSLPPEVEQVLAFADCGYPVESYNSWYEFLPGGPGQLSDCNHALALAPREPSPCAFNVTRGYKVRLYSDWAEDDGKAVLLQGINSDGNNVQTLDGSNIVDGEGFIVDNATPPTGTILWDEGGIKVVQKEVTSGPLRLYQVDPDTDENAGLLAVWGPNEEYPSYQRYFYGACRGTTCDGEETGRYRPLTFLCKKAFMPLVRDTDMVPITAAGALKNMVQAIWLEKVYRPQEADAYEQRAIRCLMNELKQSMGATSVIKSIWPGFGNRAMVHSFK